MACLPGGGQRLSVYIALPFCRSRCAYCDFNTYTGGEELIPAYVRAVAQEIRLVGASLAAGRRQLEWPYSGEIHSIFFGGGTPSLIPIAELALIFEALGEAFTLTADCEITVEVNPNTVDEAYMGGLRARGVTRLSIGVQSVHTAELELLGRRHTFAEAAAVMRLARAAGFGHATHGINLDLLFEIPRQTLSMWQETLKQAVTLAPEHLACYALAIEAGTPLAKQVNIGQLPRADAALAAQMYLAAESILADNGFVQYEISNWARDLPTTGDASSAAADLPPHFACRHNLQCWRNLPYLGFGAGAHGCAAGWRYANTLKPEDFIARMERGGDFEFPFSAAMVEALPVSQTMAMDETMLLGLRLTREGVRHECFRECFGCDLEACYGARLDSLEAQGLIERYLAGVRLTPRGRLLGNRVFREFV